jgi:membrane protease subunit (stomatin/prohibitin family)
MGLIKSLISSTSSTFGDQFKEFVVCPTVNNDVIIQRGIVKHGSGNTNYSEGVISNGSTIEVPQGMAMMIIDNGEIKEFTSIAGTYTWDTSSEASIFTDGLGKGIVNTFKTIGKRFTYGGEIAKDQRVYYVNIKTIPGNTYGSSQPEIIYDPVYNSVEITYNGEYAIKVDDPVILVNNVIGSNPKDTLTFDDIFKTNGNNMLKSKFAQKISEAISNVMLSKNISFNRIQGFKSEITDEMNNILDSEWHAKYGIIVEDVTLRINVSDETRKIVQEMDSKLAETSRMGQVYSNNLAGTMAAATAESMKNASSNENGAMMGFMGMNMATMQGNNIMNTVNNMTSETVTQANINQTSNDSLETTQEINIPKFCPECGTKVTGKFCTNCGTKLI